MRVAAILQQPVTLDFAHFRHFYTNYTYVPMQVFTNLSGAQIARFSEMLSTTPGLELETVPVRHYPHNDLAADLLGYVQPLVQDSKFLPTKYEGQAGLEKVFDDRLRGEDGADLVLVNNQNFRQSEEILSPNQNGSDVQLTIDLPIQEAAEKALAAHSPDVRGAVVVMDVRNGDVLAMVSAPAFDPNEFVHGVSLAEWDKLNDPKYTAMMNKATMGAYPPGSTFKTITGIACMEAGVLNPTEVFQSPGIWHGKEHDIKDTAGAGPFDFERAFYRSSNTYFITYGLKAGLAKLLEVAKRFHLGEKTGIASHQEVAGELPSAKEVNKTPDVCIGQEVTVTPLQMAVMTSAIANGGKIFRPRIVSRVHSLDSNIPDELTPPGLVRDVVQLNPHHLEVIRSAMLADTEHGPDAFSKGGSAYEKFHHAGSGAPMLPNFRVGGKTGTAQIKSANVDYKITWFDSYGPIENPRYAVVVVVEGGASGALTCAGPAEQIYEAIVKEEQSKSRQAPLAMK
jgi:penicillin-binding protein 2